MLWVARIISVALLIWGTAATAAPLRVVWAVASNEGLAHEPPLDFAEDDARAFADVLVAQGQVEPEHVWVRTGLAAADIEGAAKELRERLTAYADREITLFFYFSGHGDQDSLHIMGRRVALADIEAMLTDIPARLRVAVVDACRTQTDVAKKGGLRRVPTFAINVSVPTRLSGVVTLKSSSDGEASQESKSLRGAVFTHFLLTALRGAADQDQDRQVTLNEAYRYAYRQTVLRSAATTGEVMHPSVKMDLEGTGDLVLTQTEAATAQFVVPPERDAQYLVFARPAGTVLAEVWSDAEREVRVRIPPGAYMVHRRASVGSGAYNFRVNASERERVDAGKLTPVPLAVLTTKGGDYRLVRHQVALGASSFVSQAASFGPRVRLHYIYEHAAWAWSGGVSWSQTTYEGTSHEITEQSYGGQVRLGRWWGNLGLSAGVAGRAIDQRFVRLDADLLDGTGYDTEERGLGFVAGPTAALQYRIDIAPWLWGAVELQGTAFVGREAEAWAFRPEAALELMVGWRL